MFSPQAQINARTIRREKLNRTCRIALQIGREVVPFIPFAFAVLLLADGYLRLASGDLQTIHAQAEALRGW